MKGKGLGNAHQQSMIFGRTELLFSINDEQT
jgi:hypothetical protein